jgi:hypothetical protein
VNADPDFLRDLRDDFLHVPRGASGPVSTKPASLPQGWEGAQEPKRRLSSETIASSKQRISSIR